MSFRGVFIMFFKNNVIYVPFGKSKNLAYKPNLYDDETNNPFEEVQVPKEYIDLLNDQNSNLHSNSDTNNNDIAKDDILEYILKEYS